jgi:uncharacterized membrane protein
MSGESELDMVVGYLLGAGLIIVSMCVLVGILFLSRAHASSGLPQGRSGVIVPQNMARVLGSVMHGRSIQKGTLMLLAVGTISVTLLLFVFTLAFSCICFVHVTEIAYVLPGVLALVLLIVCFKRR